MSANITFSCSDIYNVSGHTYAVEQADGGIPENLGINLIIWLIIFLFFCVIRRWAWDYGRLALVQSDDKGWAKIFFGSTESSSEQSSSEELHLQNHNFSDEGYFSWIKLLFKLSDDDLKKRAGHDAIHYLGFQKCLIYYTVIICILSIVVILPVNHSGDKLSDKNHYGTTTIANLAEDSNVIWLHTIFAILYLAILIVMVWKFSQGYEIDCDPVSQLTILVTNVSKFASKSEVNQHFEEVYGEGNISNVQLGYNINQLVLVSRKLEAASLGKNTHAMYLMKHGERRETAVSTSKVCPCCPCWKVRYDGMEYFTKEQEKYNNEFLQEKETVLRDKVLGIAFVTFDRPSIVLRCIQDYSLIMGGSYLDTSVSVAVKSRAWDIERAPSPGNIIWENLSNDPKHWWIRTALINIVLFFFVLFFSTPAILLAGWNQLQASLESKKEKDTSEVSPFLNQFLPTLLLWIFSAILPSLVTWSSYYEHQWTRTRQEKSVMFKVYIFLLFMIVILPALALTSLDALFEITFRGDFQSLQDRMSCIFLPNSGAFFVNYVITSALIGTALELLRFPELVVYGLRMSYTKNEGERLLVKKEAVVEFPFGVQYAWMIAIYSIIIIYSIACPLVVPFGLLYLVLKHLVDRYNLFFNYRPPAYKYMDRSVHNTALYFLIISTFLLLLCILFYSVIRLGIEDPQTIFALIVFLITLTLFIGKVCFGWFARYTIYRRSPSLEGQEEVTPEAKTPEAYLPPVLHSSYRVGDLSEEERSTMLRRRHYGNQDHVIDSSLLRQSDDVIVDVPVEESSNPTSQK